MTQERIERDFSRAGVSGGADVSDRVDLRTEDGPCLALLVRPIRARHLSARRSERADRRFDSGVPLGGARALGPVAPNEQLVHDLLPQVIELAHRQEEPRREPRDIHIPERERRLTEAAELLAQGRLIERMRTRRCERDVTANGHVVVVRTGDDLER